MMSKLIKITILTGLSFIVLISTAFGQSKFGISIPLGGAITIFGLDGILNLPVSLIAPRITLQSDARKIEIGIGFIKTNSKSDDPDFTSENTFTSLKLQVAVSKVTKFDDLAIYIGGQIGIIRNSSSSSFSSSFGSDSNEESFNHWFLGPILGGEHFFSEHASLGGEAQFNYIKIGQDENSDGSGSIISTNVVLLFRFYF